VLPLPELFNGVTSGAIFTESHRFYFPNEVMSASSPDPIKDAVVLFFHPRALEG
jgi:hypothetical protein